MTETVEVTATASELQTESGALGKIVEGKQIQDLQLNGRNPIFLRCSSRACAADRWPVSAST